MDIDGDPGRSHARTHPTDAALMARGIDSATADRLRRAGMTLGRLKQSSDAGLAALGLDPDQVAGLRAGARPPIPADTLAQVLWANRWTCCVCRTPDRAIILHHIAPWAKSHDHGAENLAVLCLEHHARAHRRGHLEQNLGSAQLRQAKQRWEEEVRHLDPRAILEASRLEGHHWWWFNHVRVLEMAERLGIDPTTLPEFPSVMMRGWMEADGRLADRHRDEPYLYIGGDGTALYAFMRRIVEAVIEKTAIFNLSDDLDPGLVRKVVSEGDILLVQGKHLFRSLTRRETGPGQSADVRRQANGVRLSYAVDRWEAVSNSAWAVWLSGQQPAASIVRVGTIEQDGRRLHLRCTGIALGSTLRGLATRDYLYATWREPDIEDEDLDDGWFDEPEEPDGPEGNDGI